MSRDKEYLLDILESAKVALSYVRGKSKDEFMHDMECQDAVIRRLEIIGEAARRVSEKAQELLPEIQWSDMIGMRNFVIHKYDGVDVEVVWQTVHDDLEGLVSKIEKFLS